MGYIAQKNTRLDGIDYEPGQVVPDSAVNGHVINLGLVATIPDDAAARLSPEGGDSGGDGAYDPSDHTVADVLDYAEAHPDEVDAVRAAEEAGKGRTTLLDGLDDLALDDDSDDAGGSADDDPDAAEGKDDDPEDDEPGE